MIKNLLPQLNVAGNLKIGKKGKMITSQGGKDFRPPVKLDHFLITTTEKDQAGDYVRDIELETRIKEAGTGIVNQKGELIGIPIRLLYNDMDLNFPTRLASYVSGRLSCQGDGETATKRLDNFEKEHPCPCPRCEQGYNGKDKCKHMGALSCIIDEAGLFGQTHMFRTTSINSIKGIMGGIKLIQDATNGRIAGLPLMLTLNAKSTTTPSGQNTIVYVVSVCYRGSMNDLRGEVLRLIQDEQQYLIGMEKIETEARAALPEKLIESAEDQLDVAQEFFPDGLSIIDEEMEVTAESQVDLAVVDETETESVNGDNVQSQAAAQPAQPAAAQSMETLEVETPEDSQERNKTKGEFPQGTYRTLYYKLLAETDYDNAIALAKRLTKGNLIYFLATQYPDLKFSENLKKPELLKLCEEVLASLVGETGVVVGPAEAEAHPDYVAIAEIQDRKEFVDAVSEFFKPTPIDRTQDRDTLLEKVRQVIINQQTTTNQSRAISRAFKEGQQKSTLDSKTETELASKKAEPAAELTAKPDEVKIQGWDDNGLIEKPQLIKIVKLKKELERLGKLDVMNPNEWNERFINKFVDAEGNPQTSAVNLSKIQGNVLIQWLEEDLDGIPF